MKKNIDQTIVEYISTVQPEFEKLASEKDNFVKALQFKLDSMVKTGSLSKEESEQIFKQASQNPANILNYLDIPTYTRRLGQPNSPNTQTLDPIAAFALKGVI